MMTYWLWWGAECLAAVRGPRGLNDDDVRYLAIRWHDRVPLCFGSGRTPYEHRFALSRASVRTYEGGN